MNGKEIKIFIKHIHNIITLINNKFVSHKHNSNLCKALSLWVNISEFLFISFVKADDEDKYKERMEVFNRDVRDFYVIGSKTFLTKNKKGDRETFYLHCLRFYMPDIAQTTWEKHRLGVGIFTMQGYERRNIESKNVLNRFTNKKITLFYKALKGCGIYFILSIQQYNNIRLF